ncbi:MAG TPA: ATP-binding cassette domain-containing protein [Spirochaetota bacterium]|nr:ATP-binding cassette domain-containing protein [Spirochaetota bacterium]
MIKLQQVYKSFGNKIILNGVSLNIEKGETFVIIGQSGTGKTVTLRHIGGLTDPDSGIVMIDGIQMNNSKRNVKNSLREKMGIVFQSGALINWMTVEENVALPLVENKKIPRSEINSIVHDRLRILQLLDARDKMPSDISGGMKKRAGLARVLVRNPEIILYDEPTSGLDPVMSSLINNLIKRMKKEFGVTSVVVTHDMNSAYEIADRIAMLYNGEIIQCDTPEGIMNTENNIVRQFINGRLSGPIAVEQQ